MQTDLVIAICTLNRPKGLKLLLDELRSQVEKIPESNIKIAVVDNSVDQSANWTISGYKELSCLYYMHCSERGLVNARNMAMDYAKCQNSPLAFIDDDEIPSENWLKAALENNQAYPEDILAGPVIPLFSGQSAPEADIEFWNRPQFEDNSVLKKPVGDGNIIYPLLLVHGNIRYSLDFNLSGGQDTEFLLRSLGYGFRIRYFLGLKVRETVPIKRQTVDYLLDRAFHSASSWVRVKKSRGSKTFIFLPSILKRGFLTSWHFLLFGITQSKTHRVKALVNMATIRGTIFGLGHTELDRYQKYQAE